MDKKITLEVFRYRPDEEDKPTYQEYEIPFKDDWVILDAINYIKDNIDGTLSYRWSCRMGVCGSCGMMVNGIPKLTCTTFVKDIYPQKIRVEPLIGFPVERDLITVIDDFMKKLNEVKPWLIRKNSEDQENTENEYLQTPGELARYKQFSMCINCMLCYSACPVYVVDNRFTGPAVLALAHRYNLDSRDQGNEEREDVITKHEGIWDCTFVGECSQVCPKKVDPAAAIQQTKVNTANNFVLSFLWPFRGEKK